LIDFFFCDFKTCAGHNDYGVLAPGRIDNDGGCAGGAGCAEEELRVDAFGGVELACHIAKWVRAELGDKAYAASGAGRSHSLVRSLAAGPQLERLAHEGFAPCRDAICAEGEIRNKAAHHGDPLFCC
jgi:hypothetical protein